MDNAQALETTATISLERKALLDAGELLGASRLAQRLVDTLGAQNMRALEVFQANKLYESYGFKTFAEFLDKCPSSPMTKHQYYERKKLLEMEGDTEFDLLNSLNVPNKHRKLLTAGDVVLDGDQLIVGEKAVAINDAKAVRKVIAQAVQRFEQIETRSEKNEKEIEKLKKKLEEVATVPSQLPTDEASLLTQGITKIAAGFSDLIAGIRELNADDFKAFKKKHARRVDSIVEAYGEFLTTHKPTARAAEVVTDENDLSDEDLAGFLED